MHVVSVKLAMKPQGILTTQLNVMYRPIWLQGDKVTDRRQIPVLLHVPSMQ